MDIVDIVYDVYDVYDVEVVCETEEKNLAHQERQESGTETENRVLRGGRKKNTIALRQVLWKARPFYTIEKRILFIKTV